MLRLLVVSCSQILGRVAAHQELASRHPHQFHGNGAYGLHYVWGGATQAEINVPSNRTKNASVRSLCDIVAPP